MNFSEYKTSYVINLTLVVIGVLSTDGLTKHINETLALFFLAAASTHLVFLNAGHSFLSYSDGFVLNYSNFTNRITEFTSRLVTLTFAYFLGSVMINPVLEFADIQYGPWIEYGSPLILIAVIGSPILLNIGFKKLTERKLSINLSTDEVRVFEDFENSDPINLQIVNESSDERDFNLSISTQSNLITFEQSNEHSIEKEFSISPGRQHFERLKIKHSETENKMEKIKINIETGKIELEKEIDAILYPNH